jgi:hypothetical protein
LLRFTSSLRHAPGRTSALEHPRHAAFPTRRGSTGMPRRGENSTRSLLPWRSVEDGCAVDLFFYFQSLALVGFKVAHDDTRFQRNPHPRVLCLGAPTLARRARAALGSTIASSGTADERDEIAPFQPIELHSVPCLPAPDCRISEWQGSVSGEGRVWS